MIRCNFKKLQENYSNGKNNKKFKMCQTWEERFRKDRRNKNSDRNEK